MTHPAYVDVVGLLDAARAIAAADRVEHPPVLTEGG